MDTRLALVFILSAVLGAIIVITGCIKVLSKNGELNLKTAGFILAGFIFVALPVLSTVSMEWGELKILINTTNNKAMAIQKTLDSLKVTNQQLQEELIRLQDKAVDFGMIMSDPNVSLQRKAMATRDIDLSFENVKQRVGNVKSAIDTAMVKNTQVLDDIKRYEHKRWYRPSR